LRVNVRLVLVEAFVRDDHGRVIDELKKEDFRLYEDNIEQEVRHFSRDELPLAVALVVDRSGSVAPFMPELRRAAYDTLRQLKRGDRVALFAFAEDVDRLTDLTTDRRRVAEGIARIRPGGGTNILDAVHMATQYLALAAPHDRRAIILISDNEATMRGFASQDRVIRNALQSEVVVYSVKTPGQSGGALFSLGSKLSGVGSVNKITRETGGEVFDVREEGSIEAAMAAVIGRLKTRYTLGYHSSNQSNDGRFRAISVRLTDRYGRAERDYSIHARQGYYAPTEAVASQPQPAPTR
ncbi:MAG: VWA domain-containing protein, partial [Candidatus Acidiferrales bacterium]